MGKKHLSSKWLAVGIILLFVGTGIIPAIAQETEKSLQTSRGTWLYVGGSGPGRFRMRLIMQVREIQCLSIVIHLHIMET